MKPASKKQDQSANGPETDHESDLVTAARAVGSAAGKFAHLMGVKEEPPAQTPAPKARKAEKLPKKNRHRLPRRQKKAKAAGRL